MEIKRTIYGKLCEWKYTANGTKALLIEQLSFISKNTFKEQIWELIWSSDASIMK